MSAKKIMEQMDVFSDGGNLTHDDLIDAIKKITLNEPNEEMKYTLGRIKRQSSINGSD